MSASHRRRSPPRCGRVAAVRGRKARRSRSGAAAGRIWSSRPSPRNSRTRPAREVEFITGGTIDRLNKAKLAKGNPESDITFTTSHVGWLYANDGLLRDARREQGPNWPIWSNRPRSAPITSAPGPMSTPSAIGPTCVPAGIKFDSLGRSVEARAQGQDVGARLRRQPSGRSGSASSKAATPASWEKGRRQAEGAEAELQGLLRQRRGLAATDAERRSAGAGDAVDERLLHRKPGRAGATSRFRRKAPCSASTPSAS